MTARFFAALFCALALCASLPSLAQNQGGNGQGGNGQGGNGQGGVSAPEFDVQTAALGVALAGAAVVAIRARLRRPRQ